MRSTNRTIESIAAEYRGIQYSDINVDDELVCEAGYKKVAKNTDTKPVSAGNNTDSGKKPSTKRQMETESGIGSGECPQIEKEFEAEKCREETEKQIC